MAWTCVEERYWRHWTKDPGDGAARQEETRKTTEKIYGWIVGVRVEEAGERAEMEVDDSPWRPLKGAAERRRQTAKSCYLRKEMLEKTFH